MPKLAYDQLPPLADYARAAYLKERGFEQLDPFRRKEGQRRHLFWGLLLVFRKNFFVMAGALVIRVHSYIRKGNMANLACCRL